MPFANFLGKTNPEIAVLIGVDLKELDRTDSTTITDEDRYIYTVLLTRPKHREFDRSLPARDHCTQREFAEVIGVDPAVVSRLLTRRVLTPAMPWRVWFLQWVAYTKGVCAGRRGSGLG